jgi:MFS family permease
VTTPGATDQTPERLKNPWWIPTFFGRLPEEATDRQVRLLGAVAMALFVEEYDLAMLTAALPRIAADFGIQASNLSGFLGLLRLGALPAVFLIPYADRVGRRRVFLTSLVGMATLTLLTAFTQNMWQFIAAQFLTRTFFVAGAAIAFVMVTEEFPAKHRGWGIGLLGALAAVGHGAGAALYAAVDILPFGWRALYAVGFLPVVFLPLFKKAIPETERFERYRRSQADAPIGMWGWTKPIKRLMTRHPTRAIGIALVGFLPAAGLISAFQFAGYYLQHDLGWSPGAYTGITLGGGALALIGNVLTGRLGDKIGRRWIGSGLFMVFPLAVAVFYQGPAWAVPIGWMLVVLAGQGGRLITRAMSTELFPTSERAAASGLFTILETCGAAAGLFIVFGYSGEQNNLSTVIPWLATAAAASGLLLLLFPETKQKELETIVADAEPDLPVLVDPELVLQHETASGHAGHDGSHDGGAAPAREPDQPAP